MRIALCTPFITMDDLYREACRQLDEHVSGTVHQLAIFRAQASLLEQVRSWLATQALDDGADVLLCIDSDMVFEPASVLSLCEQAHELGAIVGAPSIQKQPLGKVTAHFRPDLYSEVDFYEHGHCYEVAAIGLGVTAIARCVFKRMDELCPPVQCAWDGVRPYFHSIIRDGQWYGEDYSFCRRAQDTGSHVYCDTRVRVGHVGRYSFRIEDAYAFVPQIPKLTLLLAENRFVSRE